MRIRTTIALLAASLIAGYSAVQNVYSPHTAPGEALAPFPPRKIYGGLTQAMELYGPSLAEWSTPIEPVVGVAGLAIDGASSAVVDTLTLPLTVPAAWNRRNSAADQFPTVALHENAEAAKAEILKVIPPGTKADDAKRIMRHNGFTCGKPSTDNEGRLSIWCDCSKRSSSIFIESRWQVSLYLRNDVVDDVKVLHGYVGP